MPFPDSSVRLLDKNYLILDEQNYNVDKLRQKHSDWMKTITLEQHSVYDEILGAVVRDKGGVFFVYGYGGTGKTYLWSILGAVLRCEGYIVLNVASSGIAALLMEGGRTAHSRFGIPIDVNDFSTCSMKAGSHLAQLIKLTKLIIWDEALMMNRHCFETLDRSMRDVLKCDEPFGGKVVVLGGDFRQILPVVPEGGRAETLLASLNSSTLWCTVRVLKLRKNMRLSKSMDPVIAKQVETFSKWILDIGDGKIGKSVDGEADIEIPEDLPITDVNNPIESLIDNVYGSSFATNYDPKFYKERAILTPKNVDMDMLNRHMLSRIRGDEKTYLSSDSVEPSDAKTNDVMVYSQEFLNSIQVSGFPYHNLKLKVGAPIMLLRNIDPRNGLCNCTRLLITQLADHVLEAAIVNENSDVEKRVLLTRMFVTPTDPKIPFRMRRRQFPISLAYAITINKSQGQTLKKVGLFLPKPVFTHGQLYVAISRVTSRSGLKILIVDKDGKPQKNTTNVVFGEVFKNID